MRYLYLVLAVLGAIVPYLFFFKFINQHGVNIPLFIQSLFVNGAAGGFTADLLITSVVFWLFMFAEKRRDAKMPRPYMFVFLNITIGLSCALPAYLYARLKIR